MFSFAYPLNLLFLLLVPAIVLLYVWARHIRRRNLAKFGKPEEIADLMPEVSPYKPPLKITVAMIALTLVIIAAARPWGAAREESSEMSGIEIMIAVDASNSMLASATSETDGTQRMRTAKTFLERLINELNKDRVGLLMYAASAKTLVPLTSDYMSTKAFLNSIEPANMEDQGTNIADAINTAADNFNNEKKSGRAIVLLTDAEDLEDQQGVIEALDRAASLGIQVDVVGVGTSKAVPIPYGDGYFIDWQTGETVMTALNEDLAEQIAARGKGIYVNASNANALPELVKQLHTLQKTSLKTNKAVSHDELYSIFLWVALVLIVADVFLLDRKIGWLSKITFFRKEQEK